MEGGVCNNTAQDVETREAKRKEGWSPHRHTDTEPLWSSPSDLSAELWFHLHIMCRDALHVPDTLCPCLPVLFEFPCFFSWSNEKSKRKALNGYLMRFYTIWKARTFFGHRQSTSICCHFQDSPSPFFPLPHTDALYILSPPCYLHSCSKLPRLCPRVNAASEPNWSVGRGSWLCLRLSFVTCQREVQGGCSMLTFMQKRWRTDTLSLTRERPWWWWMST